MTSYLLSKKYHWVMKKSVFLKLFHVYPHSLPSCLWKGFIYFYCFKTLKFYAEWRWRSGFGNHVLRGNHQVNEVSEFAFEIDISFPIVIYWLNQNVLATGHSRPILVNGNKIFGCLLASFQRPSSISWFLQWVHLEARLALRIWPYAVEISPSWIIAS